MLDDRGGMNAKPLTEQEKGCILKQDGDGLFSVHYWRNGWHRQPLWREVNNRILILDPATKRQLIFGWAIHPEPGLVVAVLKHL